METVTYRNRRGDTYYLSAVETKNGKTRFTFSRQPKGKPVAEVPEGHEIWENVHGQVSLRKIRPSQISDLELREVQSVIKEHPHLGHCKVEVKGKSVIIYAAHKPNLEALNTLGVGIGSAAFKKLEESVTTYDAVMRFNLVDASDRSFVAERMCYRGSADGWLDLVDEGSIGKLARKYMKHIGKDSFFELPWG